MNEIIIALFTFVFFLRLRKYFPQYRLPIFSERQNLIITILLNADAMREFIYIYIF